MSRRLPRIFVASTVERLDVAYAIQELLEFDAEVTVWTEGTFRPGKYTLDELAKAVASHQFGVFVFVPDDRLTTRGETRPAVRDNLIFEFGLFAGAHGWQRCFFVLSRGGEPARLPSDLEGLTPLTYAPDRSDNNLIAALGPACNRVRRAISEDHMRPGQAELSYDPPQIEDYVLAWDSGDVAQARTTLRQGATLSPYDPEDVSGIGALKRLFVFLESMADAVLSGRLDETALRRTFEEPVCSLWPHILTSLAPPSGADDYWRPLPKLAELYTRWRKTEKS